MALKRSNIYINLYIFVQILIKKVGSGSNDLIDQQMIFFPWNSKGLLLLCNISFRESYHSVTPNQGYAPRQEVIISKYRAFPVGKWSVSGNMELNRIWRRE